MAVWLQWCALITATAAAGAGLGFLFRGVTRLVKKIRHFLGLIGQVLTVLLGEEDRPDIGKRLDSLEEKTKRIEWHVGNGNEKPLRELVEGLTTRTDKLEQTRLPPRRRAPSKPGPGS